MTTLQTFHGFSGEYNGVFIKCPFCHKRLFIRNPHYKPPITNKVATVCWNCKQVKITVLFTDNNGDK